jgi:hypothetical protein
MDHVKLFLGAALILAAASVAAHAADFDGSKPLLCSVINIMECTESDGCQKTTIENTGMPQFLKVDPAKKVVTPATPIDGRKPTQIERMERVEGKLILQGAEEGIENVRDGLGWTAAISETTGKFILTASGEEVAFVVFGACIAQ